MERSCFPFVEPLSSLTGDQQGRFERKMPPAQGHAASFGTRSQSKHERNLNRSRRLRRRRFGSGRWRCHIPTEAGFGCGCSQCDQKRSGDFSSRATGPSHREYSRRFSQKRQVCRRDDNTIFFRLQARADNPLADKSVQKRRMQELMCRRLVVDHAARQRARFTIEPHSPSSRPHCVRGQFHLVLVRHASL